MENSKSARPNEGRVFFYYPGLSKKHKNRRIVLAGFVKGNQILVAEAQLFGGQSPTLLEEQDVQTRYGPATAAVFLHDAVPPDTFNKKYGRGLALDKCRGYYYNIEKNKRGVDYINGTYTDPEGTVHELTKIPCDELKIALTINIPEGEQFLGKLFVSEVTKVYPPKPKKAEPVFTLTQVNKYLASLGVNQPATVAEIKAANLEIADSGQAA